MAGAPRGTSYRKINGAGEGLAVNQRNHIPGIVQFFRGTNVYGSPG